MDQQAHQLTKDLFDRRFAIFTAVEDFITWVIRSDETLTFSAPATCRPSTIKTDLMNQLTITLRKQRVEIFRPYLALFHKAVAQA